MNKNGKKVAVILLLAVVAVGSYFVSGTYARYSRALSGSDTATVAKFSVSGTGLDKEGNATFDLFNTELKEADINTAEDNVLNTKIAPGTGGFFKTTLTNDSEVDVTTVLKLKETANASKVPIEYSTDKTTWKAVDTTTKEVELTTVDLDYVGKTGASVKNSEEVTVYWRWAIDANTDDKDTELGEAETAPTVETTITATFTQKD